MIFFQKFFDVSALNLFEDLLECKAFFKAQLHLGQLFAVAQLYGGVEQVAQIIDAAPYLRHAAVDVQQGVDRLMPVRIEYSVVKMVSRTVSAN